MSELPISSPYRSTPDAPVSETERNTLNARLNAAFEAGALDSDDFSARLDKLFAAQKMGELVPVVEGLPPLPTYQGGPGPGASTGGASGQPGQLSDPRSATRLTVAVIGVLVGVVLLIAILLLAVF